MGNTPTKDKKEDIYASYIQRQQDLIYKQQNQINSTIATCPTIATWPTTASIAPCPETKIRSIQNS